jgi:hypothetical protein
VSYFILGHVSQMYSGLIEHDNSLYSG